MKIKQFFARIFGWLKSEFEDDLKKIFDTIVVSFLSDTWSIAKDEVWRLNATDLAGGEKRSTAFHNIKSRVEARGLEAKDSLINLAIELSVAYLKKLSKT